MKKYDVEITETLQMTVSVWAESKEKAEKKVREDWESGEHVLGDKQFAGVKFKAVNRKKSRDYER